MAKQVEKTSSSPSRTCRQQEGARVHQNMRRFDPTMTFEETLFDPRDSHDPEITLNPHKYERTNNTKQKNGTKRTPRRLSHTPILL